MRSCVAFLAAVGLSFVVACSSHPATGSSGGSSGGTSSGTSSSGSTGGTSSSGWSTAANCPGYVPPQNASPCICGGHHCSANACSDGDFCQLSTSSCVSEPYLCTIPPYDGGPPTTAPEVTWTGTFDPDGGVASTLYFAVVGDTRPADEGITSEYPVVIINQIFQDIQEINPEFVIATGDYQYADPSSDDGMAQVALYAQARSAYSGIVFPVMGNHECDGYTADDCDPAAGTITSGGSGPSNNFAAFKSALLGPINQALPYYAFEINDVSGAWTAKFVVTAANAWDTTQQTWLQTVMAIPTTYTFVMRHESSEDNTAPGVTPSDAILQSNPYTLLIVGHSHYFREYSPNQVVVGNGGAPLDDSSDTYGYALLSMTTDGGNILVQNMDFQTNQPLSSFVVAK